MIKVFSLKSDVRPALGGQYLAFMKAIGENIKKFRVLAGKTQEHVAEDLHITQQQYSRWESGTSTISAINLRKLAQLFNVTMDAFFESKPKQGEKQYGVVYENPEKVDLSHVKVLEDLLPYLTTQRFASIEKIKKSVIGLEAEEVECRLINKKEIVVGTIQLLPDQTTYSKLESFKIGKRTISINEVFEINSKAKLNKMFSK